MLPIRHFMFCLFVIVPLAGVQALDGEAKLHANWLKLCKSGTELRGANSIGDTILNCPEDDIEAKAARSHIRDLAFSICSDANNSCSADASRIFAGMQCESLLSVSRAAKCGGTARKFDGNLCESRIKIVEFSLMWGGSTPGSLENMVLRYSDDSEVRFASLTLFSPGDAYAPTPEELKNWQRANSRGNAKSVSDFVRDSVSRYIDENCDMFLPSKGGRLSYENMKSALKHYIDWATVYSACPQGNPVCVDRAAALRSRIKGSSPTSTGAVGRRS